MEQRLGKGVTNTSPLIALGQVGQLHLLDRLFEEVIVPAEVSQELLVRDDPIHESLMTFERVQFGSLPGRVVFPGLGIGESAAIELTRLNPGRIVLLDER